MDTATFDKKSNFAWVHGPSILRGRVAWVQDIAVNDWHGLAVGNLSPWTQVLGPRKAQRRYACLHISTTSISSRLPAWNTLPEPSPDRLGQHRTNRETGVTHTKHRPRMTQNAGLGNLENFYIAVRAFGLPQVLMLLATRIGR